MLTTTCIMCNGRISWNAVACPHCGDPSPALRNKLRQEERANNPQSGYVGGPPTMGQTAINGVYNTIVGLIIMGGIGIGFYLMSTLFR